jgi:hypothetical protein
MEMTMSKETMHNSKASLGVRELTTAEIEFVAGGIDERLGIAYEAGLLGGAVIGGLCYMIDSERGLQVGRLHR